VHSDFRAYPSLMHPIEHLRHVARSRPIDETELTREAAIALGSMRARGPDLVVACRRIVERHPQVGPLWWLCSRLLTSDRPNDLAWEIADEIDADRTANVLASHLAEDATVLTIGWPAVTGAALTGRGDVRVLCADSRHEASAFLRQLERAGVECDPVPAESLARAIAAADLVLLDGVAASSQRILAPIGSHVVAAVAASLGVPVWCTVGLGRRLPVEYVDAIAGMVVDAADPFEIDIDDLPVALISCVVSAACISSDPVSALRAECALAPELLRSSPI
jgi:hypothetical protein